MNFSFYIFGTPNGYNQYPADSNSALFQEFAKNNTDESQLTVYRKEQLVYYSYVRRLQEDSNSNYLGFCLTFNGVYCQDPKKLFDLFEKAFSEVQDKGELSCFDSEKCLYLVEKFSEKQFEIERIKKFFQQNLDSDFSCDFVPVPAAFKFGNNSKTISVNESDSEILATIADFDIVHISSNETLSANIARIVIINKGRKWLWLLLVVLIVGASVVGFLIHRNNEERRAEEKRRYIELQQQIQTAKETVSAHISVNTVYTTSNNNDFHLFKDCNYLRGNITEMGVRQAIESGFAHLCQTCVGRVANFEQSQREVNDSKALAGALEYDGFYYLALEWIERALQMRPDNREMIELRQQIQNRTR